MSLYHTGYILTGSNLQPDMTSNLPTPSNIQDFNNPDFVLGIFDSIGSISNSNNKYECTMTSYDNNLLDNLSKNLAFPHTYHKNTITLKNSNFIDFLGYLYQNSTENLYNRSKKHYFYNNVLGNIQTIKAFKIHKDAIIPHKSRLSDAGFDLSIISVSKNINSNTIEYHTGLKIKIPNGYYVKIVPRSSLSKYGYILSNLTGIIDQGYTGELMVRLTQVSSDALPVEFPFRCCQLILEKQHYAIIEESSIEELEDTHRNTGGFGSTT